ncbi:hypothetical protein B0181_05755 [Moraxella caviae]|uniref:Uncharacterized protein n=1 Tax=Moraxella caviae TaxID=34060 RepID=A0A1T0A2D0_9GAMM|nr:hypothetical protein [Moraxella caviae]OOR89916.1 hypothetical protein B0181_05755 [Moraxella caviae]STZ14298.1 Uncharacterised protein [Moraxella caviae]VEW12252.1 Uncharacterised protein [Moraxella caviae]
MKSAMFKSLVLATATVTMFAATPAFANNTAKINVVKRVYAGGDEMDNLYRNATGNLQKAMNSYYRNDWDIGCAEVASILHPQDYGSIKYSMQGSNVVRASFDGSSHHYFTLVKQGSGYKISNVRHGSDNMVSDIKRYC